MNPVAAAAILAFVALCIPVVIWYVFARIRLANNPNLIRAGVGSVKVGLFLRLQRRRREQAGAGPSQADLLAAAIVNGLFGVPPKDDRVAEYTAQHGEEVTKGLLALAEEPEPIRGLIATALAFQSKLPATLVDASADPSQAILRAQALGITPPGNRSVVLWGFVKEAAAFLRAEHRQIRGTAQPPAP